MRLPPQQAMAYGADYYPEQWPEEVWDTDVRLMREAGVNIVNVATFSWALIQPAPETFDFAVLDRIMDLLADAGIAASLATPTAAPPAWFFRQFPHVLPVRADGTLLGVGARESYCASAPEYREAAATVARSLAVRYADHPALAMWHVNNEYGAHVGPCYCDRSAQEFRRWLRRGYGTLEQLNDSWNTMFWGQRYSAWEEIMPPREAPMPVNSTQRLDFMRFSNEQYLECYQNERDVLRSITPHTPITTNIMAGNCKEMEYWQWSDEVDFIANSSYLDGEDPASHIGLAMSADLARAFAHGEPWLLMEHSTGAVNWQPRNIAKVPGQMRRNSLAHIARGSEGAMFFQWRASRYGSEKFHSAMVPHAGTSTQLWADVVSLGRDIAALGEVKGSRVLADVAIVWDSQSWWAMEFEDMPTCDLRYMDRIRAYYAALWRRDVTVDFVPPSGDLTRYRAVLMPSLYLLSDSFAQSVRAYVDGGGTLFVGYFSGIVDEHDRIHPGPFPGGLRDVLGLSIEEFHPLCDGQVVELSDGSSADIWSERVVPSGARTLRTFGTGPDAGHPALTRNAFGKGTAWYLAANLGADALAPILETVLNSAGASVAGADSPVETVRRTNGTTGYLFLINHDADHDATVDASGVDLLTGRRWQGTVQLPPSGVVVLRQA